MAKSFGVINSPHPLGEPGMTSPSYALEVSNETFVEIMVRYATMDTPVPFLMYIEANITFWPRSDWPKEGFAIMRPVYMIGWSDELTGIDFGNCVGCASLTGKWSNLTLDSLVLENLAYGNPEYPDAMTHSVVSSTNMWAFNMSRWACGPPPQRGGG